MCLAIPGKLIEISNDAQGVLMGRANFGGIVKQVCLEYTPEVVVAITCSCMSGLLSAKWTKKKRREPTKRSRSCSSLANWTFPMLMIRMKIRLLKWFHHPSRFDPLPNER